MRPSIELSHLKYFYFAVVEGGVGPAADRLCVQQPVVSKMIKSLEGQLGQALFRKVGRKNTLTDFGQLVYRHSQSIFDELEKLGQLELKSEMLTGPVNIGAAEPIAGGLLPAVLASLTDEFPGVNPNVYTATASQLLDMLSQGKLDVGFFFHTSSMPTNVEIIQRLPLRFHLVIKKSLKNDAETIQSFIGSREIDDLSNQKFPTVELLRKTYPKTRIRYSSNHLGLHRELVLQGKGVSILPGFLIQQDLDRKSLVDLYPSQSFQFDLKVVARKGGVPTRLVRSCIERLQKQVTSL